MAFYSKVIIAVFKSQSFIKTEIMGTGHGKGVQKTKNFIFLLAKQEWFFRVAGFKETFIKGF